ncbi:MAG: ATP-binding cassette domain-containing protein [Planctomycetes bacterium]|nr:ATP-binding cassette domain-containing protein [Planctomycetota bacterium]
MIRIEGFGKEYDGAVVLEHVSLEVARGESLVVVGSSGCGKSTLLRHVAGIEGAETGAVQGRISVGAVEDITRLSETAHASRRVRGLSIGYLFQDGALFDFCTVEENLAWPLSVHTPLEPEAIREKAREALELVEMASVPGILEKRPGELSGGQRKRIALARALVLSPDCMLYDEPTAGLDPPIATGISRLIRRLKRTRGLTSITCTHDMACARVIADRIAYLAGARIVFTGTFQEALEDPALQEFIQPGATHAEKQLQP